ncbi:MAG: DUF92 domain-containing protein [Gemmatimonadota bacterium]|nr:MAG: DUF92 domain-containing protein [Gemmatimonadota bacterium]
MTAALAATLAGVLAVLGRWLGWLDTPGAVAAAAVGTAVFAGGGTAGAALLAIFFVSGSLLTRHTSRSHSNRLDAQTSGRNARQVVANGGCAAAGALLALGWEGGWAVLLGALAAAQADTWATEIGAWSGRPPRLITTGAAVPPGTSGGVTLLGSTGGLIGSAIMAAAALALGVSSTVAIAGLLAGFAAMMWDSVLGASVQGSYHCATCDATSEQRLHTCGSKTRLVRGWSWLDNDAVNLIATCSGGAVAVALWSVL